MLDGPISIYPCHGQGGSQVGQTDLRHISVTHSMTSHIVRPHTAWPHTQHDLTYSMTSHTAWPHTQHDLTHYYIDTSPPYIITSVFMIFIPIINSNIIFFKTDEIMSRWALFVFLLWKKKCKSILKYEIWSNKCKESAKTPVFIPYLCISPLVILSPSIPPPTCHLTTSTYRLRSPCIPPLHYQLLFTLHLSDIPSILTFTNLLSLVILFVHLLVVADRPLVVDHHALHCQDIVVHFLVFLLGVFRGSNPEPSVYQSSFLPLYRGGWLFNYYFESVLSTTLQLYEH